MYSDTHEIIFVHQRKAAGTYIKSLFADTNSEFNNGVRDADWEESNFRVNKYFKFTVIRNPWDRFISGWKYLKSTKCRSIEDVLLNLPKENLIDNILYDKSLDARLAYLKEFSRRKFNHFRVGAINSITNKNLKVPHDIGHDYRHITRQQFETVFYTDGRLAVDKIMFLENLEKGFEEIILQCKSNHLIKPFVNFNQKKGWDDYRKYFNDKTLDLFNSIYKDDINIWGYNFDDGPGVPPKNTNNFEYKKSNA